MLKNKVVIVTGAGRGIGKGIAEAFAKEGSKIVVSDINKEGLDKTATELQKINKDVISVSCDVSDKSEVDKMVSETVEKFGGVDVLINNAGIFPFKPFMELTEDDWEQVINVNLKSMFLCSQAAAKEMKNGGKIVNISSIAAFVGFEGLAHYCASKGGVDALTRELALEFAKTNINVNSIAPGAIDTPGASAGSNKELKNQTIAAIPQGRMGTPADIANAVVFLASNKADYITGQVIIVDGGYLLR